MARKVVEQRSKLHERLSRGVDPELDELGDVTRVAQPRLERVHGDVQNVLQPVKLALEFGKNFFLDDREERSQRRDDPREERQQLNGAVRRPGQRQGERPLRARLLPPDVAVLDAERITLLHRHTLRKPPDKLRQRARRRGLVFLWAGLPEAPPFELLIGLIGMLGRFQIHFHVHIRCLRDHVHVHITPTVRSLAIRVIAPGHPEQRARHHLCQLRQRHVQRALLRVFENPRGLDQMHRTSLLLRLNVLLHHILGQPNPQRPSQRPHRLLEGVQRLAHVLVLLVPLLRDISPALNRHIVPLLRLHHLLVPRIQRLDRPLHVRLHLHPQLLLVPLRQRPQRQLHPVDLLDLLHARLRCRIRGRRRRTLGQLPQPHLVLIPAHPRIQPRSPGLEKRIDQRQRLQRGLQPRWRIQRQPCRPSRSCRCSRYCRPRNARHGSEYFIQRDVPNIARRKDPRLHTPEKQPQQHPPLLHVPSRTHSTSRQLFHQPPEQQRTEVRIRVQRRQHLHSRPDVLQLERRLHHRRHRLTRVLRHVHLAQIIQNALRRRLRQRLQLARHRRALLHRRVQTAPVPPGQTRALLTGILLVQRLQLLEVHQVFLQRLLHILDLVLLHRGEA